MGFVSPIQTRMKDNSLYFIRTAQGNDGLGMFNLTKEVLKEKQGLVMIMEDFFMTVDEQARKNDYYMSYPKTLNLVAEHKMNIVGILTIEPDFYIKTAHRGTLGLIVKKEYRSKGVGKALMKNGIQWARSKGQYEKLELEVLEKNESAISLYRNLGFNLEGVKVHAVKHESNYESLYQMGILLK